MLDFRELNEFIECHTGDDVTDVCGETIREWRKVEGPAKIVDLRSAYLQIRVARNLWQYQKVRYKGTLYCLTRLGFGLNSAPRMMSKILKTVLSKSQKVQNAANSYIDDILIDEGKASTGEVIKHLNEFGLETKPPAPLEGGAALGLQIRRNKDGELSFQRGNELPVVTAMLTRRELFS